MKNKCFKEVSGFEELAKQNDIKICFLHDPEFGYDDGNPKRPEGKSSSIIEKLCRQYLEENGVSSFDELGMTKKEYVKTLNGKFNYRTVEEANLYQNRNRNLGFVLPKESENFDELWVAIDVDGQDSTYMVENDVDLKKGTRRYLFECIKYGLNKRGIKFLCCTTANDGFHFYFKTKQATFNDHGFNIFTYPSSHELMTKICPNIFDEYPIINSIVDKRVANKAIEVFTKGKFVVAPGSVINGRKYSLLPDGVQDFRDVSVYDGGSVEELIIDILREDCYFVQDSPKKNKKSNGFNLLPSSSQQDFSETNIKNIGDFIIYAFQHISGQKHYATLALGGFLYNQNISQESILKLGEYIIDNAPDTLFKESKEVEKETGFLRVLMHDAVENEEKEKTGLTTLKEIFRETEVPLRELTKILWVNSAPQFHNFYPNGVDSLTYKEVSIDFRNKETKLYYLKKNFDEEEGEKPPIKMKSQTIKHVLTDMNYIDDISRSKISRIENMPIMFTIKSRLMKDSVCIKDTTKDMIEDYDSMRLAHSSGSKEILSLVMDEYESIGLIGTVESSKIPGIYLSRDRKQLRKFISLEGEIVEVFPEAPPKEKLINSLNLLKKINDAYPWFDDKFATFAKLGMILPYGYVFKSEFGSFIRGIILYGEAGTCKSSASELIEYMNIPAQSIKERELDYLVPGSEFSTVYRMGNALDKHSYPIAIEEVENVFDVPENRDLIKNSITRKFIRNPGGEQEYYARAIPVFSANELNDEIEKSGMFRRFLILNFISGERGDKEEVEKSLSFLNENGVRNSRFKELYTISEYVYYVLANHIEYFGKNPQGIIDTILESMQQYTGLDLSWLIEPKIDKYYQTDRSEEDQTDLTKVIDILKYHFKNSIKLSGVASNIGEQFLENLIEDKYSYIFRVNTQRLNGVLITKDFNNFHKRQYPDAKKLSLARLAELLNDNLELKYEVKVSKIKPNSLKKRIKGVYMNWEDFCNIFNIKIDKEEE